MSTTQPATADDILTEEISWDEPATTGQRLVNYIVDVIVFYVAFFLGVYLLGYFIDMSPVFNWLDALPGIIDRIIGFILYGLLMMLTEGVTKGKSLGKLITRTRAVDLNGNVLSWKDAVARGFSRMVPFEAISGIGGHPWHDSWTNTRVIKIRRGMR